MIHNWNEDALTSITTQGVGNPAKRHVALDVEFAPSFVDNKVINQEIKSWWNNEL